MKETVSGKQIQKRLVTRDLPGKYKKLLVAYSVIGALYHLYAVLYQFPETIWYYNFHVCYFLILIFAIYTNRKDEYSRTHINLFDIVNIILALSVFVYMSFSYTRLIFRMVYFDEVMYYDAIFGVILIYLIFTAVYRLLGKVLLILSTALLLYAFFGNYVPGKFNIPGYSIPRIIEQAFLYTDGIFGLPIAISATYIFVFVVFGSFLSAAKAGEFIFDFSQALVGGTRGGIAKISVITSALFGSISGSPIANVCVTGAFTIPNMKKSGYSPVFAGAVEAVASTGGCITPPVMGAVAFVMSEVLGVSYLKIIVAAIIPAFLYYFILFVNIDIISGKLAYRGIPKDNLPKISWKLMRKSLSFFGPMIVLVWILIKGWSPTVAAFGAIVTTIIIGIFIKENRIGIKGAIAALDSGVRSCASVVVIMASTGIVIGILNQTGLGIKVGHLIFALGGDYFLFAAIMSMIVCLILGMGMNITPAYLITVVITAPALIKLGSEPIAAHLFIVYFAALAGVTPPIAVTSFTAAGISDADPMQTGIQGFKLGMAGFMAPFLFLYNNALILIGDPINIIVVFILTCASLFSLMLSFFGWWGQKINVIDRIFLGIGGLLLLPLFNNSAFKYAGIFLLIIIFLKIRFARKKALAVIHT